MLLALTLIPISGNKVLLKMHRKLQDIVQRMCKQTHFSIFTEGLQQFYKNCGTKSSIG